MNITYILYLIICTAILPIIIWGIVVQVQVDSTFKKFSKFSNQKGFTADAAAKNILESQKIYNIKIVPGQGNLTDHFDPKNNLISLSKPVYGSTSIAAIGVAAHECGHAIQSSKNYLPLKIRAFLVPIVNLFSTMFLPLLLVGIIFSSMSYTFGIFFTYTAISFYGLSTLFYLVTLPVELNASKRALNSLKTLNILDQNELNGAKQVLKAAAMTYIVAFLTSLIYLLRFVLWIILVFGSRRD